MIYTVTKKDLKRIAEAYPNYHMGAALREIIEIFDDGEYTLHDLLNVHGERVFRDIPAVYISQEEYDRFAPEYRESHPLPAVGNKYEYIPRRVIRYERYITPLFYSAVACRGVRSNRVIVMVSDKIFGDFDFWEMKKLYSWSGSTEKQQETATYLYNYYLRIKLGTVLFVLLRGWL